MGTSAASPLARGRICYKRKKINLSRVFAGQAVGIKQVEDHIWPTSLWVTIWDISMMRRAGLNLCRTLSVQSVSFILGIKRNL
ncbi:hypothetical protein TAL182_CH00632 [Rhizobium sp. TAL182]|nr:hypothetical protein TAL182_CH00632 [Rhizobium sp. TAL182]